MITEAQVLAAAKASWNLHASIDWDIFFKAEDRAVSRQYHLDCAREAIKAADDVAHQEEIGCLTADELQAALYRHGL